MQESLRAADRRRALIEYVFRAGSAQVEELASHFGVSRMTIHRDLDILDTQGIVRKVYGGVTVRASNLVESNVLYRSHVSEREKQALAQAAAEMIEPGQAIIVDDSTTAAHLASFIPARKPLTVITNSLTMIEQIKDTHGVKTICLGGDYNPRFNAFFGYMCEQSIASLRANTLFMSTSTAYGGAAYHQEQDVVKTKRALMAAVDRRILMLDSSKFGMTALIKVAALSEFDVVLTDSGIPRAEADALRKDGVKLRIVSI